MVRRSTLAVVVLALMSACSGSSSEAPQTAAGSDTVLYEGARLIDGSGGAPIENSAFLVQGGAIVQVGASGQVTAPAGAARVDLTGKTVMPALVNAHGHPGYQRGLTYSKDNYTRETFIEDMNRAAYFGVGTVLAQGIDNGDLIYEFRRDQQEGRLGGARLLTAGRGIGAPNAGPGAEAYRGVAYEVSTVEEAVAAVREVVAKDVDVVKLWVDDRGGRAPRMTAEVFRAIIAEAHAHDKRVNAHVFYHVDAEELVDAGVDAFAHMVRDKEMDDALIAAIVQRNVYVMPNLASAERGTHGTLPPWMEEPYLSRMLQATVAPEVIARMRAAFEGRDPAAVDAAAGRYAILERSLAKLNAAGAPIILGADTGVTDHFFGYAEQREIELMHRAGMSPMQVIVASTSRPAEYLGLDDVGRVAPGHRADFLVLDANPLDDIRNTRSISQVYLGGAEVDRAAIQASLTSPAP